MNETDWASLTPKIEAAFLQASRKIARLAKQTGTPVIVWKDGRVHEIPCDQLDELIPQAKGETPAE